MIGEFFAYYLGRASGRREAMRRRRPADLTQRDVQGLRVIGIIFLVCAVACYAVIAGDPS